MTLASSWRCACRFEPYMVVNPKDRFPRDVAWMILRAHSLGHSWRCTLTRYCWWDGWLISYLFLNLFSDSISIFQAKDTKMSHLMRLWHVLSSVNSFFEWHTQLSSEARCPIFGRTLCLLLYFMCANSEGCGETARMHRLAWALAGRICGKYHNLMSWLKWY